MVKRAMQGCTNAAAWCVHTCLDSHLRLGSAQQPLCFSKIGCMLVPHPGQPLLAVCTCCAGILLGSGQRCLSGSQGRLQLPVLRLDVGCCLLGSRSLQLGFLRLRLHSCVGVLPLRCSGQRHLQLPDSQVLPDAAQRRQATGTAAALAACWAVSKVLHCTGEGKTT